MPLPNDPSAMKRKVIYDFGANNGDDIPYYLLKSDLVVAVEANPRLCSSIRARFQEEIGAGRLVVENCVITAHEDKPSVDFYIHKTHHVLSQLPIPPAGSLAAYEIVHLPCLSAENIVRRHGDPYYIKIDLEHYDAHILRSLFRSKIFPPFISCESHTIEVFSLLVAAGGYNAFKLVDGRSVPEEYLNCLISSGSEDEQARHSFPPHSAGPFGNDIKGPWMSANNFFRLLALEGLGWKDVHATRTEAPDPEATLSFRAHVWPYFLRTAKAKARRFFRRLARRVNQPTSGSNLSDKP